MKSVRTILYELAGDQDWNDTMIIELLSAYTDAQQNNDALEDFLVQRCEQGQCCVCDAPIPAGEHSHECLVCGETLCNYCATASARCLECENVWSEIHKHRQKRKNGKDSL